MLGYQSEWFTKVTTDYRCRRHYYLQRDLIADPKHYRHMVTLLYGGDDLYLAPTSETADCAGAATLNSLT